MLVRIGVVSTGARLLAVAGLVGSPTLAVGRFVQLYSSAAVLVHVGVLIFGRVLEVSWAACAASAHCWGCTSGLWGMAVLHAGWAAVYFLHGVDVYGLAHRVALRRGSGARASPLWSRFLGLARGALVHGGGLCWARMLWAARSVLAAWHVSFARFGLQWARWLAFLVPTVVAAGGGTVYAVVLAGVGFCRRLGCSLGLGAGVSLGSTVVALRGLSLLAFAAAARLWALQSSSCSSQCLATLGWAFLGST